MKVRDVVLGSQYVVRPRSAQPVIATALQLVPPGQGHAVPTVLFNNAMQVPGQAIGLLPGQTGSTSLPASPPAGPVSIRSVRAMGLRDGQIIVIRVQGADGVYEHKERFRGFGKGCMLVENPFWTADHRQVDATSTEPRLVNKMPLDSMVLSVWPGRGKLYVNRRVDLEGPAAQTGDDNTGQPAATA